MLWPTRWEDHLNRTWFIAWPSPLAQGDRPGFQEKKKGPVETSRFARNFTGRAAPGVVQLRLGVASSSGKAGWFLALGHGCHLIKAVEERKGSGR